jgi:hypothetical protein
MAASSQAILLPLTYTVSWYRLLFRRYQPPPPPPCGAGALKMSLLPSPHSLHPLALLKGGEGQGEGGSYTHVSCPFGALLVTLYQIFGEGFLNGKRNIGGAASPRWGLAAPQKETLYHEMGLEAQDCPLPTHRTHKEEPPQNAEIRDFFGYEGSWWVCEPNRSIGPLMRGYLRHPYVCPKPLGRSQQTSSAKE